MNWALMTRKATSADGVIEISRGGWRKGIIAAHWLTDF
jgi:hypothetical protein